MELAIDVANIDPAIFYCGSSREADVGFERPLYFTCCEIEGVERSIQVADQYQTIFNHGRGFKGSSLDFVLPQNFEFIGQLPSHYTVGERVPPSQWPVSDSCFGRILWLPF